MGNGQSGAIGYKNNSYYWIKGSSKYSDIVWGRWTEETKDIATYPRLTTGDNSNNLRNSTFWRYRTNRFNLTRVQLTYDLPETILTNTFINKMSVYFKADNLLTLSKERKHMEMTVGGTPQCRLFNIGVQASF